jgi:hypothetical protein
LENLENINILLLNINIFEIKHFKTKVLFYIDSLI